MRKIFKEDRTPTQKVLGVAAIGLGVNYIAKYYKKNKKLPTTLIVLVASPFLIISLSESLSK
tara:strand:+ start:746 stop:931 length:186 start_codon:yes stop_codon:yes gene_type:complete